MQKFTRFIILTLLITLSNTQILPIPEQMTQLVNGVVKQLNLPEKFGVNNCLEEINSITTKINQIPEDLQNKNYLIAFTNVSQVFAEITKVFNKCPEIKTKMQEQLKFLNAAYHAPGQFLHDGIDSNIGFSGLKNLYNLLSELEEKDLTEAGMTLAKVMEKFSSFNFSLQKKTLMFLSKPESDIEIDSEDPCLKILEKLIIDLETMAKNILKDIKVVKSALDDFMGKLKMVPAICINKV